MFNIGGAELLVILLVALLVLGPNKLPQAARQVGHFLGEFRRIADGFQQELKTAMDDPVNMAPKKPAEKPKSPGGPTVIDADATEREDSTDGSEGTGATAVQADATDEPAAAEAGSVPDAAGAPTTLSDADDDEA